MARHLLTILTAVALVAGASACTKSEEPAPSEAPKAAAPAPAPEAPAPADPAPAEPQADAEAPQT